MASSSAARVWAVVPAAGVGRRMGSATPKQYLELRGRPVVAHTIDRLGAHARVEAVAVAVSDSSLVSTPVWASSPVAASSVAVSDSPTSAQFWAASAQVVCAVSVEPSSSSRSTATFNA